MTEPMHATGRNLERIENSQILKWLIATAAAGTSSWTVTTYPRPPARHPQRSAPRVRSQGLGVRLEHLKSQVVKGWAN